MDTYTVRLEKDELTFSAAHFITFAGNVCERLHGHNYGLVAEITGPLDENEYVVDFIALRDGLKSIVSDLDHHMLLPTTHAALAVRTEGTEVHVDFQGEKRWVFPAEDCLLLPVSNTTAERLAQYIGQRLLAILGDIPLTRIRIAVDENHGQWASWERDVP
ncbi:MAG: 6-pyruvoyl tetrahydropterin synthase family protein [Pirellulaceae bacterium]|jgi:6-pyruvoyltetrahydropterin/6-carboxytetrahydropterin synthase|nr:6-pyruvoyl tetrahydropterin synthase family protein [Planctomycetaceae bacterium]HIM27962.1 6-pyruvoyl tetrahydropterin synthase family protein [Planctomycetota bacterium]